MPLIHSINANDNSKILLWRITETEDELRKFSSNEDIFVDEQIINVRQVLRRLQKIVALILLKNIANQPIQIQYTENGKPYSDKIQGYISISNTQDLVAVIHHPTQPVGIDLEIPSERILKIASKFINQKEREWLNFEEEIHQYYLIWGVKESIFKAQGGGGIDFKENLLVNCPIGNKINGEGISLFIKNRIERTYKFHYSYLDEVLMVYTIAE